MPQDPDDRTETEPKWCRPEAAARRRLDAVARARIGRGLRLHYADVLALPIPERLRTLLDDLDARSDPESPR